MCVRAMQFFHADHGEHEMNVVVMGNEVPSQEILDIIEQPSVAMRVRFLEGSTLVDNDLKRADACNSIWSPLPPCSLHVS